MKKKKLVLITLILIALCIPNTTVAKRSKQGKQRQTPLTQTGEKMLADYTGQLNSLKTQIEKALPKIDEKRKSVFLKAQEAEKATKAALETIQENFSKIKTAQALVTHAKDKWIGGADKGIAKAKVMFKNATTEAERNAAKEELIKWQKNREEGVKALRERLAALNKAKRQESTLTSQLETAKKRLEKARAGVFGAFKALKTDAFLAGDTLDSKLAKYIVLFEATPRGLAEFAQEGKEHQLLTDELLKDADLMKQMVTADGAQNGQYGRAMEIYTAIQKVSSKAGRGVLQRLALAVSLEHAVPIGQRNPKAATNAPSTVDPVNRYLHFEKAYLNDELDPAFKALSVWDLRMVVDGYEPDRILAWGREMLRNYRPDHILTNDYRWRYVAIVRSDIPYGYQDTKYDKDDLQFFQNILMNGGICGRRAFFGRFILRAFGIPTTARPQTGHAALVHWTPDGWVICLGAGWGHGWTKTRYKDDLDFLATTQAREHLDEYMQVKRAQWIGDVLGEKRVLGFNSGDPGFWYAVSLYRQKAIIEDAKSVALAAVGEDIGEANETKETVDIIKTTITEGDRKITVGKDRTIKIPAAACSKPTKSTRKIIFMPSDLGGKQLHYSRTGGHQTFEYTFNAPQGGKYELTARVVTPSWKQHLFVTVNGSQNPVDIALPFTVGMWDKTEPVQITLTKGKNVLTFSREQEGLKGVTIKDFTLMPVTNFNEAVVTPTVTAAAKSRTDMQQQLPDPDGKPADMSKPVQVYILLGQSNMVGMGHVKAGKKGGEGSLENAVKNKGLYPYLVDDAGNWTIRKDVRYVRVMGSGGPGKTRLFSNEFMTIKGGRIGPEYGIGYVLGHVTDAPVMILKSCIGNRSLGWDLLPPGSKRYEVQEKDKKTGEMKTYIYAGYGDSPDKWEKGTEPQKIRWTAGIQYAGDIDRAKKVLAELDTYYPGAKGYEIAGFFFWQGDKDRYNAAHADHYEQNLVRLIKQLRKDFNAPNAKFVCATLGQTKKGADGNEGKILEAQLAVDGDTGKYPEFKGNVATVYSNPLCHGGASNSHYDGNAETYMDIGQAMGWAMDEMDLSSCTIGASTDGQSDEYLGTMDDFRVYSYALSQSEIVYLTGGGASVVQQPLVPLEIAADPQPDGRIDLRDFALIASEWLSER